MAARLVELPVEEIVKLIQAPQQLIARQKDHIQSQSGAPSKASMRCERARIAQLTALTQRLSLDAPQQTEKMVLYHGEILREPEFNAIPDQADAVRRAPGSS